MEDPKRILEQTGVDPNRRVHQLSDEEINRLRRQIDAEHRVEGVLRAEVARVRELALASGQHRRTPEIVANLALGLPQTLGLR
jgi:small subunit ribosomal protein S13